MYAFFPLPDSALARNADLIRYDRLHLSRKGRREQPDDPVRILQQLVRRRFHIPRTQADHDSATGFTFIASTSTLRLRRRSKPTVATFARKWVPDTPEVSPLPSQFVHVPAYSRIITSSYRRIVVPFRGVDLGMSRIISRASSRIVCRFVAALSSSVASLSHDPSRAGAEKCRAGGVEQESNSTETLILPYAPCPLSSVNYIGHDSPRFCRLFWRTLHLDPQKTKGPRWRAIRALERWRMQ